jgi:hypothetical protein
MYRPSEINKAFHSSVTTFCVTLLLEQLSLTELFTSHDNKLQSSDVIKTLCSYFGNKNNSTYFIIFHRIVVDVRCFKRQFCTKKMLKAHKNCFLSRFCAPNSIITFIITKIFGKISKGFLLILTVCVPSTLMCEI